MANTYVVAHARGWDELTTAEQRKAKYGEPELGSGHVSVTLHNGDVHEYVAVQGAEVSGRVDPVGVLEMSTGRVYGVGGWVFVDGDVDNRAAWQDPRKKPEY